MSNVGSAAWRPALLSDFAPGDRLGRYELVRTIGGGGFAAVWRARTVGPGGFERAVAIKVIRRGRASQKRFQDMLLDEARLVARIQHPNVAQIWEVGEDPRSLYFAMELVEGASLDELRYRAEAAGKTLPVRAVFRVLADICGGLHAAHELALEGKPLGLVHRDVSPQNILVSHHGTAKLIDFGIAKARERLAGDTTTGYIKGKISYMAPEQARAEEIDRRADLWAIGAVAFDLLEGRPPFDGETDLGRLASLVGPAPAPSMSDRVPAPLRAVVSRTLQKDPDARYATALELKEALEEALIESEMETTADECAALFQPYFRRPTAAPSDPAAQPAADAPAPASPQSVERPVSSTIEAPGATEAIQLPLARRPLWPLLVGAAVIGLPLGFWALSRSASIPEPSRNAAIQEPETPRSAPSAGTASLPAGSPATTAGIAPPSTPETAPSSTPSAAPSAAISASAAPSTPSAATVATTAPTVQHTARAPVAPSTGAPRPAAVPARSSAPPRTLLPDDDAIE